MQLAKCLKYCGYQLLCDIAFGAFLVIWIAARHISYMMVCWSIYAHSPEILPTGCFKGANANLTGPTPPPAGSYYLIEPFLDSTGNVCYNETVKWAFLTTLLSLQGITVFWFALIMRVAIRVIRGQGSDDPRSDEEDEGEEEEEEEQDEIVYDEAEAVEEDVGVEGINFTNWERRNRAKRQSGMSSGVSLPGHSDRKELLGRIGCEKQVE